MKNSSAPEKPDSKIHVRKKVAGGATGVLLGAAVAGPIGAIVGGALGTMIGNAAEQGGSLEMPKRVKRRSAETKVRSRAKSTAAKGSPGSAKPGARKKKLSPRGGQRAAGSNKGKK